jgi:hypothetical protein
VPCSASRQVFKLSCTLFKYGAEGCGVLANGISGGCGHAIATGDDFMAQPVTLSANGSSISKNNHFTLFSFIFGILYLLLKITLTLAC